MADMLNWLVVGIGDITTRRVMPAIIEDPRSHLYGVVSRDPSKGSMYAERVWATLGEALSDPVIDAVYVATPVSLHAPQTIASLRAGKHVLCEKPMAMDHAQAVAMQQTAQQTGKTLGIAYYRRTYPKVLRARQLIAAGVIGQPVLAEISCHSWFDGSGSRSWLIDPALAGGGPLYDIGSHRLDLLNFLFGRPVRVTGQLSNAVHTYAVEDSATLLVEYESGVRGILDVRWHSRQYRDEFRITGTDGEINLSPLNDPALVYPGGQEELSNHSNFHYPCIQNFTAAVLDGAELLSSGATAQWTDWITAQACTGPPCQI
jgi:1,5-anhydro-D-fructose reductase (1,5-anhydro-D-mannitol-forming)